MPTEEPYIQFVTVKGYKYAHVEKITYDEAGTPQLHVTDSKFWWDELPPGGVAYEVQ